MCSCKYLDFAVTKRIFQVVFQIMTTKYNKAWEDSSKYPQFEPWIQRAQSDFQFQCKLCVGKHLSLGNMGQRALISHSEGETYSHCINDAIFSNTIRSDAQWISENNHHRTDQYTRLLCAVRKYDVCHDKVHYTKSSYRGRNPVGTEIGTGSCKLQQL